MLRNPGGRSGSWDGDPTDSAVRAEFDWSTVPPSVAIVETVALATDRDPEEIPTLNEVVDPDAVDGLVRGRGTRSDGTTVVSFEYAGVFVSVHDGGEVVVVPDETPA